MRLTALCASHSLAWGQVPELPDTVPSQVQFTAYFALRADQKAAVDGSVRQMMSSANFVFDESLHHELISGVDSITGPITALAGTCCGVDNHELALFFTGGTKWSIRFDCDGFGRGVLYIAEDEPGSRKHTQDKALYYVHLKAD